MVGREKKKKRKKKAEKKEIVIAYTCVSFLQKFYCTINPTEKKKSMHMRESVTSM